MAILKRVSPRYQQRELGFGKYVATDGRMMNPDGSFNVIRRRSTPFDNVYYRLVTMPKMHFFFLTVFFYGVLSTAFALLYLMIGLDQLGGMVQTDWMNDFQSAFFFSSQTLTTVGYGHVHPVGLAANLVASFESFLGVLSFALMSGLLYGRFSRPTARILYSEHLLLAPYKDGKAFMFRMANARQSELIETEVTVILALNQRNETTGAEERRFFNLELEISRVTFFSLSWTIVHAVTEQSPIWGFTQEDLAAGKAEFLVMVKGVDEATEQLVHSRRSYLYNEVMWNARFKPILEKTPDNRKNILHTPRVGDHEVLSETF